MKKIVLTGFLLMFVSLLAFADEDLKRFKELKINDEVVYLDLDTNLMWQEKPLERVDFITARNFCKASNYAGFLDWRLPKIKELKAIVNIALTKVVTELPYTPPREFWSSTEEFLFPQYIEVLDFANGFVRGHWYQFSYETYGRCVRP